MSIDYGHLHRMSDDAGLFEHARGALPRREHGYCLDDVARGLLVLSRIAEPSPDEVRLMDTYLAFVAHAQAPTGAFRNRLQFDRRWTDEPAVGDWWGRAMCALGTVAAGEGPSWQRDEALHRFGLGCRQRSPSVRSMAYAGLGAAAVLASHPDHGHSRRLLADAVDVIDLPADDDWPWPEPRLTYANAVIPELLLAAGAATGDAGLVGTATALLDWLTEAQTLDGRLSPVPVGGSPARALRHGFDQQPIEVAALAEAAARASTATGDRRWRATVDAAGAWFDGANDLGAVMHDTATGGGFDGLTADGVNLNQGAESTLAWLATAQLVAAP